VTDEKDRPATLASELDRTRWDYSPRKDRSFLLAPLARLFSSIAWEFRPKHLGPASVPDEPEIEAETIEEVEATPGESAENTDRRR